MSNVEVPPMKRNRWPNHVENVRPDCIALLLDMRYIGEQITIEVSANKYSQKEVQRLLEMLGKKKQRVIELLESVAPSGE